jgi:hypothetical protein
MITGFGEILLAVNLWTFVTPFVPYGLDQAALGVIVCVLGVAQLVALNLVRNLWVLRFTIAASAGFMAISGAINTKQVFFGDASFQLPIVYVLLAALQWTLMFEPPVNPMTARLPDG